MMVEQIKILALIAACLMLTLWWVLFGRLSGELGLLSVAGIVAGFGWWQSVFQKKGE